MQSGIPYTVCSEINSSSGTLINSALILFAVKFKKIMLWKKFNNGAYACILEISKEMGERALSM